MVGFAFGFLGREHGQITIHSHMLAVLESYRHLDLGSQLKQAQRERAIAMGIHEMTWTFDPLQSRNAHFNFSKLGVVSDTVQSRFLRPGNFQHVASQRHRPPLGALDTEFAPRSRSPRRQEKTPAPKRSMR